MRTKVFLGVIATLILATIMIVWVGKEKPKETVTDPEVESEKLDSEENDDGDENITPKKSFGGYVKHGEKCFEIDNIVERGDCLQEAGEKYLEWHLPKDKQLFSFPFQHDQDHWQDVFYKKIDDADQLSSLIETDYFDDYVDPFPHYTNYDRGEKLLDNYWYVFSNLIPREYRESVKYVYWTDTEDDFVYAVGHKHDDLGAMLLLFSHNLPYQYDSLARFALLHEFGHTLTLNGTQVDLNEELLQNEQLTDEEYDKIVESCETIYVYGGCANEDSYIYSFYQQFWEDIDDTYQAIDWDNDQEYREFFFEYEDRFFNSYQGTSVVEDIADQLAFFIHTNSDVLEKPEMKYQKISFFYEFDELVELRTTILENLYNMSVEDRTKY